MTSRNTRASMAEGYEAKQRIAELEAQNSGLYEVMEVLS